MDNILACYKDGTNGTRNCRYFGVVYHLAFIVILCGGLTEGILLVGVNAFMSIMIGMAVAIIQPYKDKTYNIVDTVLILSVGLGFVAITSLSISSIADPQNNVLSDTMAVVPFVIPLFYISGYVSLKVGRKLYQAFRRIFKLEALLSLGNRRLTQMYGISENTALVQ